MIMYESTQSRWIPESPYEHTLRKALELISKLIKAVGYKVNIHKWIISLYTNNEQMENKIKIQFYLQ